MTTQILAPTSTAGAVSDPVAIAAGESKTIGIFVAAGDIPADVQATVRINTPGAPAAIVRLNAYLPAIAVAQPGTYTVRIDSLGVSGVAIGAFRVG